MVVNGAGRWIISVIAVMDRDESGRHRPGIIGGGG